MVFDILKFVFFMDKQGEINLSLLQGTNIRKLTTHCRINHDLRTDDQTVTEISTLILFLLAFEYGQV